MTDYNRKKEDAARKSREESRQGRDIGSIPPVENQQRRDACEHSLRLFCETYHPNTFYLGWSEDHLKVIENIENVVFHGGNLAMAMPRGSGKSTLCEAAIEWMALYGHRWFPLIIGPSKNHAAMILDSIKEDLKSNDLLLEDFPEVCYPIRMLEGITQRCKGQLCDGVNTNMSWGAAMVILPTIAGSLASSVVIRATGLTESFRGMKVKRPDGKAIRPDFAFLDDPQTDESAKSVSQTANRESIIRGAVLGLAGPGKKIAAICACTVIKKDDLADRLLDRERNPDWQGITCQMVYKWPDNDKLWDEYASIRAECLLTGENTEAANEFYRKHRREMDAGSVVAWPDRFDDGELSALQHAYNLRLTLGDEAFFCEYQNSPIEDDEEATQLNGADIVKRVNGYDCGIVPQTATCVTAFIDVHDKLLYWAICAWDHDSTGYVIDYGSWPDQKKRYFQMREVRTTLRHKAPGAGREGAIAKGLDTLIEKIGGRELRRQDGSVVHVEQIGIDAGYLPDEVDSAIRRSNRSNIIVPAKGLGIKAANLPMSEYKKTRGDRVGHYWRIPVGMRGKLRQFNHDVNYWKSWTASRLRTAIGDRGALTFYGKDRSRHRLFADHCTAEYFQEIENTTYGRKVQEWFMRPQKRDNHLWDCLVGCSALASKCGVQSHTLSQQRRGGGRRRRGRFRRL